LLLAAAASLCGACASTPGSEPPVVQPYKAFEGLAPHTRTIGSPVAGAQKAFDQGLTFLWAFNHDEALSSFSEAARLDPQNPMGFWGIAACLGPHINNSAVPEGKARMAHEAAVKAVALASHAPEANRGLIAAMAQRYSDPPATDRAPLDQAYADAMRAAAKQRPDDVDIQVFCAEALMDLHPWDLWTTEGQPKEWTPEIVKLLEGAMAKDPRHPGALHLYIHAVEASGEPGRALAAADKLRTLVPVSGHMCHMPSHIDVLLGHWDEAIASNEKATAADTAYIAVRPKQEFHHMYMAHNQAMLAFAAMMDGRSELAISTARKILPVAADYAEELPPAIEPSYLLLYDALIRFGRWEEMLAEPEPPSQFEVAMPLWHHARGVAFAALGRVQDARDEQAEFRDGVADVPADRHMAINTAHDVFAVADHMLEGEICWAQGDTDGAVSHLHTAIELEDKLAYMEPPEWAIPVRHALGAILLKSGRTEEAEIAYRQDLKHWPENGWSLHGLADCLDNKQGGGAEATEVHNRFKKAWAQSDLVIETSCLCVARG
jgi:cytochrome c-type biogenesis protein CcmH/NrfG